MDIEYLNENNAAQWEEFARNSSSAWFRHTLAWQKYSSCCRFDSNTRNFSFMVKQWNQIQAIVPLLVEYSYPEMTVDCFAMYGDYTPMPAFTDDDTVSKALVVEAIRDEVARIVEEQKVAYGKFIIDPLIGYPYFRDFSCWNLLEEGAQVKFSTTNIVDLTLDEETILRKMRKGHKAAIKQMIKTPGYRVEIYDQVNITKDKLLRFKEIHKIDAGRQTRTDASWECMYEWIQAGNACLVMVWSDALADFCSAALIMHFKEAAYYASFGTVDSSLFGGHIGEIIQWEAIKYLKAHGIARYETGDNYFGLGETPNDRKLLEIARYKRGFRTVEIPKITFRKNYISL